MPRYRRGPTEEEQQGSVLDRVLLRLLRPDPVFLNNIPPAINTDDHPILQEDMETTVESLKERKSAGMNKIPAELIQSANKIWQTGECPTLWTQLLVITLPKKGNPHQCQNSRTISLIYHPRKVMLKILLNRLRLQAETIFAEEQASFRAGCSTTEQIFSLILLCERYLQHQQDLYHIFVDFKKAFDRM